VLAPEGLLKKRLGKSGLRQHRVKRGQLEYIHPSPFLSEVGRESMTYSDGGWHAINP